MTEADMEILKETINFYNNDIYSFGISEQNLSVIMKNKEKIYENTLCETVKKWAFLKEQMEKNPVLFDEILVEAMIDSGSKLTNSIIESSEETINEILSPDDPIGKWIHDFVHSDNPKFKGKSKKKRIKMAVAAYYAAQKKNESVEPINELSPYQLNAIKKQKEQSSEQKKDIIDDRQAAQKVKNLKTSNYNTHIASANVKL